MFLEDDFLEAVDKKNVTYPIFSSFTRYQINYASTLGGMDIPI